MDQGKNAYLECQADANPFTPDMITWIKKVRNSTTFDDTSAGDDDLIIQTILEDSSSSNASDSRVKITLENNRSFLMIANVTREDTGLFECVAYNRIGSPDSATAKLVVKHKPVINRSPSLTKSAVDSHETGRLFCRAEGAPNVTFQWTIEGQVLKTEDGLSANKYSIEPTIQLDIVTYQSTLVINRVSSHDYGTYKCVARNQLGYDSLAINFTRTSKPDCPLSLKVINITSESVTLKWIPGFDGGLPQSFRLRFKTSNDSDPFLYSDVFPSNTTSFTISSLSSKTEYTFHVMAYNSFGESDYTVDNVKAETLKQEVSAASEKVLSQTLSGRAAEIPRVVILIVALIASCLLMLNVFLVVCFLKKRSRNKKRLEEESDQSSTSKNPETMNELFAGNGGSNGGSNYSHDVTETSFSGSDEDNKRDRASSSVADFATDIGRHSSHDGLLSMGSHQTYLIDDNFYPPTVRFDDRLTHEPRDRHVVSLDSGQPDLTMDASFPPNIMYSSLQRQHLHHHHSNRHHSSHHHHHTLNPHSLYQHSNLLPHHHSQQSLHQPKESLQTVSASVQTSEYHHLHHQNDQNQYNQQLQQHQQLMNDQQYMMMTNSPSSSVPPLPPLRVTPHLNNNNNAVNNINGNNNGVNFSLPSISEEVFLGHQQLPVGHLV